MSVLDASALLAWVYREDGHELVAEQLTNATISTVNWSEVLHTIAARGADADQLGDRILALGPRLAPFGVHEARAAAALYPHTRPAGLSLADRACLALAGTLQVPALTADRAWNDLALSHVEVTLIR